MDSMAASSRMLLQRTATVQDGSCSPVRFCRLSVTDVYKRQILTSSTKERLEQLEETKRELEARIAEEKLAKPKIKEEFIRFWLMPVSYTHLDVYKRQGFLLRRLQR